MALSPIKKQNIQRDEINSIFSGMNNREIAKKSILSMDWLFQKIRDPKIRLSKMSRPELGRMYLYCYDAKWKDVLPYWDQYPVTIVVDVYADGFAGMNFHYLPIDDRLALLNILTEQRKLERVNPRYAVKVTYPKLATLGNTAWKNTWHRYLYAQLRTKLIDIPPVDWSKILHLPIAMFHGAGQLAAWGGGK